MFQQLPCPPMSAMMLVGCGASGGGGAGFAAALDGLTANLWHASSGRRRLLTSWTNALIKVREATGSTEHDIAAVGAGVLDKETMETACGAGDGFAVSRYDQSGNARALSQATSSQQPKVVDGGSAVVDANGNAVGLWDNADDVMSVGGITPALTDVTVIATGKLTVRNFFDQLVSLNPENIEIRERGGEFGGQLIAGGTDVTDLLDDYPVTEWRCWTAQVSGTDGTMKLWLDGNLIGSLAGRTIEPINNLFLGARDSSGFLCWGGHISELAVFDAIIDDAQRIAVQTALMEGMPS